MGRVKDDWTRQIQSEDGMGTVPCSTVENGSSALLGRYRDALERILEIETYRHPEVFSVIRSPAAEIAYKALKGKVNG